VISNESGVRYAFTKLVVDDLESMARYYGDVYGLREVQRVRADLDGSPIDEIILGLDGAFAGGLILFKFLERPAPGCGEVILGFTTGDIHAVAERAVAAGGTVVHAVHAPRGVGVRLVCVLADPEGHLAEVVEP
jgi:lactoylglutathione lyase